MFKLFEETPEGCWLWTGYHDRRGVPVVNVRAEDGQFHSTTVINRMWQIVHGHSPSIGRVTHRCGVKSCIRPDHLIGEQTSDLWRIDEKTGCWIWLPRKMSLAVNGVTRRAARIMWLRTRGEILLPTATVENGCGHPRCVNPDHLYLESVDLWEEDPVTGCWLWKHQLSSSGGGFAINGQRWIAHRRMWFLIHGTDPREELRHTCGVTRCVNPGHLALGPTQNPEWFTVTDRGCWEWNGIREKFGYGRLKIGGKQRLVHRLVWALYHGPIPDGMMVRHVVCDNPPCCNPEHLALGTGDDNTADMVTKLRGGHKLTWKDRDDVLALRRRGTSYSQIAARFGVDVRVVMQIVRRQTYVERYEDRITPAKHVEQTYLKLVELFKDDCPPPVWMSAIDPAVAWFTVTDQGCWEWKGGRSVRGYGRVWTNKRAYFAHRRMWEVIMGPIPVGLHVMHRCDNPPCVNPAHLKLGTALMNARDMSAKLRSGQRKLTYEQADEIRERRAGGMTLQALAGQFGVSNKTILRICQRAIYVRPPDTVCQPPSIA